MIRYVGDSYEKDVLGAKNAGMAALLLLREGPNCLMNEEGLSPECDSLPRTEDAVTQALKERFPAADVSSFSLQPEEVMRKLLLWHQEQQKL